MGMTIAEAAERTGLTAHTLRYYERDGLMLHVGRDESGHRSYGDGDLGWIELITKLRRTGMAIRDVRRYAEMVRAGEGNEAERLELLRAHRDAVRARLVETERQLEAIDLKVDYYAAAIGEFDPDAGLTTAISTPRRAAPAAPC